MLLLWVICSVMWLGCCCNGRRRQRFTSVPAQLVSLGKHKDRKNVWCDVKWCSVPAERTHPISPLPLQFYFKKHKSDLTATCELYLLHLPGTQIFTNLWTEKEREEKLKPCSELFVNQQAKKLSHSKSPKYMFGLREDATQESTRHRDNGKQITSALQKQTPGGIPCF